MSFELPLPGWLADVEIALGRVPAALAGAERSGVLWQATARRFLLEVPGVGRYLVEDGRSVLVEPDPGCASDEVVRLLHATPLAALCHQRGLSVLHAAAAARDGAATLIAGSSGAGKSAVLAELLVRGWRIVTDDVAPISLDEVGRPIALPTFPELRLGLDVPGRIAAAPAIAERAFEPTATPLKAIWWLSTGNFRGAVKVDSLPAVNRFEALGEIAYNRRLADAIVDPAQRLRSDAPVAEAVPIRRVSRPRGSWTVTELADLIDFCQTVNCSDR